MNCFRDLRNDDCVNLLSFLGDFSDPSKTASDLQGNIERKI
ncbi:hypothetical protein ES703_50473 [subsurface metagenome]